MKSSLLARSLLCALALVPPHAASAGESIQWPNPWEAGRTLVYETEHIDSDTHDGKRKKARTTDTTEIRITEASVDGFVQRWVSSDVHLQVLEGDKAEGEAMLTAMKSFEGFPVMVELDKEANYRRIRNLDSVAERLRTALRPMIVAGIEARVVPLDEATDTAKSAQARDAAMAQVDGVLARMTAGPVVESMLGRVIQNYNSLVGVVLEDGERYTVDTEIDSPVGGRKFPATVEFGLYASEDDPTDIFIEWTSTLDPKKGMDAIWDLAETLIGTRISTADRKGLPKQVSLVDEGFMIFNRDSGVVEMFESTRTVELGSKLQVDRNRMRLVNEDHAHTWTAETAESAEAIAGEKRVE